MAEDVGRAEAAAAVCARQEEERAAAERMRILETEGEEGRRELESTAAMSAQRHDEEGMSDNGGHEGDDGDVGDDDEGPLDRDGQLAHMLAGMRADTEDIEGYWAIHVIS
ncbi:hypothetical protein HK104_011497 [Borealophlyctis nickersoniae]|nr:hypothetical protein HK104_011497 [Borealophlyctis nickersoniae]